MNRERTDVAAEHSIALGTSDGAMQEKSHVWTIPLSRLVKPTLVCGAEESSARATAASLLAQAWQGAEVPFLVIEPTGTHYRNLHRLPGYEDLRIYQLGNERHSPFRLNPFELPVGGDPSHLHIQAHIAALRAAFGISYVLWGIAPQVLDMCLAEVYQDHGWDLISGENVRVDADALRQAGPEVRAEILYDAFPTLTDLYNKLEQIPDRLAQAGYHRETRDEVRGALQEIVGRLRSGQQGLMLDTHLGLPFEALLQTPAVLELEPVSDFADKRFILCALLIHLHEHYVAHGTAETQLLQHLTLVEDAHLILRGDAAPGTRRTETRASHLEVLTQLLSSLSREGEGIILAENTPSALAPQALDLTDLRVIHRLSRQDDADAMRRVLRADADQLRALTTLPPDHAFAQLADSERAELVRTPDNPIPQGAPLDDEATRARMQMLNNAGLFYRTLRGEALIERLDEEQGYTHRVEREIPRSELQRASITRRMADLPEFTQVMRRYFLSTVLRAKQVRLGFGDVNRAIDRLISLWASPGDSLPLKERILCASVERMITEQGAAYGWPYRTAALVHDAFLEAALRVTRLVESGREPWEDTEETQRIDNLAVQAGLLYRDLCRREQGPLAGCSECQSRCFYRLDADLLVRQRRFVEEIEDAWKLRDREQVWQALTVATRDAARRMLTVDDPDIVNALALCVAAHRAPRDVSGASVQQRMVQKIVARYPRPDAAPRSELPFDDQQDDQQDDHQQSDNRDKQ